MKDKELIIKQRAELAEGIQELISLINNDTVTITEELKIYLYSGLGMIRVLDWSLDESELGFEEFCKLGNDDIANELGFSDIASKFE